MSKKLYEVEVIKTFYVYSDTEPDYYTAEQYASDDGVDNRYNCCLVTENTLGWPMDSLVYGPDEDITIKQALEEVNEEGK